MSVWGSHILLVCNHLTNLTRYHNLPPSEPGVKDLFEFIFLLIINCDRTRLQRLQVLHNFIWDVGVDAGDRYDRVDVLLSCGEAEFDSSWGDDLGNGEGTSPLVVQFLHGVVRGVVLETYPGFVSDPILWCHLMVLVIILLHVICCSLEGSLHLLLGMT